MSVWIVGTLSLFLFVLSWVAYFLRVGPPKNRNLVPFLLRSGAFFALLIVLGDFELSRTSTFTRKPLLRVFFDNSVSVTHHQSVSAESLREGYQEITTLLKDIMSKSEHEPRFELYSFGSKVDIIKNESFNLDFSEPTTNLAEVLRTTQDIPPDYFLAGVVLVTDGQYTMGDAPEHLLDELDFHVHTIGIGNTDPMVDVQINKVEVPTVGIKGEMVKVEVQIESVGKFNERVHVSLSRGKKLLGSKVISVTGGGSVKKVRFQFRLEKPGTDRYIVQVTSIQDEVNIMNNRNSFTVTTLKDRFRIGVVTGAPSANTGFIKRVLRREERFKVDHFVNFSNNWEPSIETFWRTNYDVIILDNLPTLSTPRRWAANLQKKLDRESTALMFIAGPNVSKEEVRNFYPILGLQKLSSAVKVEESYPVSFLNDSNLQHILLFSIDDFKSRLSKLLLPPMSPYLLVEPSQDQVDVFAILEAPTAIPLITIGKMTNGDSQEARRAAFTSTDLWQLQFRGMHTGSSEPMTQLWKNIFGWLARITGDKDLYFRLNKKRYQQGERIHVSGSVVALEEFVMVGQNLHIMIRDNSGESRSYPLLYSPSKNIWVADFFTGKPGKYIYEILASGKGDTGLQKGTFLVEESQVELNRVFLNEKLLANLSAMTKGVYLNWKDRQKLTQSLTLKEEEATVAEIFRFSHWVPLFIIVLFFLTSEWAARKVIGLQ